MMEYADDSVPPSAPGASGAAELLPRRAILCSATVATAVVPDPATLVRFVLSWLTIPADDGERGTGDLFLAVHGVGDVNDREILHICGANVV